MKVICLYVLACVEVHCIPHYTGVISKDDEGPDVTRWAASLHTTTALQLQVVIRKLFNQEVSGTCKGPESVIKIMDSKENVHV